VLKTGDRGERKMRTKRWNIKERKKEGERTSEAQMDKVKEDGNKKRRER
jgi:hypothetical protein